MIRKQQKGKEIVKKSGIKFDGNLWIIPSQTGRGEYTVDLQNQTCTCPDFSKNLDKCKHQYAVDEKIAREFKTVAANNNGKAKPKKIQTPRNWSGYRRSQTEGRGMFLELLGEVCRHVEESSAPRQTGAGRKFLPVRDAVFGLLFKVYEVKNSRSMPELLADAAERGFIGRGFSYNTVSNYLQRDWMTPILGELVTVSSLPLAAVETSFSVDSSGFGASTKKVWRDVKHGNDEEWHEWIKAHIIVGNLTKVVISAVITPAYRADSPYLARLIEKTAKYFRLEEVMADAAYSSRANLELIEGHNAQALVAFRASAVFGKNGETWDRRLHAWKYQFDEVHERYRFRSNVETAFSALKKVFGSSLRSRSETGRVNELLAKIICHNLRALIRATCEFNIDINLKNMAAAKTPPNKPESIILSGNQLVH
jgi:transposase